MSKRPSLISTFSLLLFIALNQKVPLTIWFIVSNFFIKSSPLTVSFVLNKFPFGKILL